jgi:hypothetical protein
MREQKLEVRFPKSSGVGQTSILACTLLANKDCNRRTQENATSLVIRQSHYVMQACKKKKKKEKEKEKLKR